MKLRALISESSPCPLVSLCLYFLFYVSVSLSCISLPVSLSLSLSPHTHTHTHTHTRTHTEYKVQVNLNAVGLLRKGTFDISSLKRVRRQQWLFVPKERELSQDRPLDKSGQFVVTFHRRSQGNDYLDLTFLSNSHFLPVFPID